MDSVDLLSSDGAVGVFFFKSFARKVGCLEDPKPPIEYAKIGQSS